MHTFRWVGCSLTFLIRSYVSEPDTTILNPAHACIETRGQKYPLSCLTLKWSNFFPYPDLLLCINLHYKILTTSINKSRSCSLTPSMLAVIAVYEYGFLSFLFNYLFIYFLKFKTSYEVLMILYSSKTNLFCRQGREQERGCRERGGAEQMRAKWNSW